MLRKTTYSNNPLRYNATEGGYCFVNFLSIQTDAGWQEGIALKGVFCYSHLSRSPVPDEPRHELVVVVGYEYRA